MYNIYLYYCNSKYAKRQKLKENFIFHNFQRRRKVFVNLVYLFIYLLKYIWNDIQLRYIHKVYLIMFSIENEKCNAYILFTRTLKNIEVCYIVWEKGGIVYCVF